MTDAAFSLHALTAPGALMGGEQPTLETTQLNGGSFYDCYETADGRYLSVGGLEPQFFMQFCAAIGRPELAPEGLVMVPERVAALKQEIRLALKTKTYAEWSAIFAAMDSCTEPVLSFSEACEHPHIQARGMLVDVPQLDGGQQRQLASPFKFSATPPSYQYAGVILGQHTDEVLMKAGLTTESIAQLKSKGVVA